jgi:hypothetical protein
MLQDTKKTFNIFSVLEGEERERVGIKAIFEEMIVKML